MIKPINFMKVTFSLKTNIEPMLVKITPNPLNMGNIITEGTALASLVITRLITQRDSALAVAHEKYLTRFSLFLGIIKNNNTKNEIKNE